MGGDQDGAAILDAQLTDQCGELSHTGRIDAERRLIHDDDFRVLHEDIGDAETLPHTSRVGARLPVRGVGHADPLEEADGPLFRCFSCEAVHHAGENQVLTTAHVRIEADIIRQVADDFLDRQRIPRAVEAIDFSCTGGRIREAEQHQGRGGLAGAVRTEQTEDLAFMNLEVQVIDRGYVAVLLHQLVRPDDDFVQAFIPLGAPVGRVPDRSILKLGHDQCLPYLWNTSPRPQMTAAMMRMPTTPQRVEVLTVTRKDWSREVSSFCALTVIA